MKEGAPIERCPQRVVRAAGIVARELAGALVAAGEDPKSVLPFVRGGIQTAEEVAGIVVPPQCVKQVVKSVLPIQELGPDANPSYIRK